jgi:hypothetical protein
MSSDIEYYLRDRLVSLKGRAKRRGITCTITVADLLRVYKEQDGFCFYTDIKMLTVKGSGKLPNGLSVDRVHPTKGYEPDNFVLCTNKANNVKSNLNYPELAAWISSWYKRLEQKFPLFTVSVVMGGP